MYCPFYELKILKYEVTMSDIESRELHFSRRLPSKVHCKKQSCILSGLPSFLTGTNHALCS